MEKLNKLEHLIKSAAETIKNLRKENAVLTTDNERLQHIIKTVERDAAQARTILKEYERLKTTNTQAREKLNAVMNKLETFFAAKQAR